MEWRGEPAALSSPKLLLYGNEYISRPPAERNSTWKPLEGGGTHRVSLLIWVFKQCLEGVMRWHNVSCLSSVLRNRQPKYKADPIGTYFSREGWKDRRERVRSRRNGQLLRNVTAPLATHALELQRLQPWLSPRRRSDGLNLTGESGKTLSSLRLMSIWFLTSICEMYREKI